MKAVTALCLLVALLLVGCSARQNSPPTQNGGLRIVTSVFPAYDLAKQVCGDGADISMLVSPGEDSHSFEPSPRDMAKIENCDIFIYIGGSDEYWAEKAVSSANAVKAVRLSDSARLLFEDEEDGHEHEHSGGELFDPHIWTSPKNMLLMLDAVCEACCQADQAHADSYTAAAEKYAEELKQLDTDIRGAASSARYDTLIFADKFAFRYFTDEYGFKYAAAFPSCDEHSEPGAKTVASLIDTVKENSLPAVYYFKFNSPKVADTVASETGAKALMLYSCHTVSQEELDNNESYVSLMRKNLESIKKGLGVTAESGE